MLSCLRSKYLVLYSYEALDAFMGILKKRYVYLYILTVASIQRYLRCHDCLIIEMAKTMLIFVHF